ncbi:MAG: TetR family transcriptional regulator [Reichenbachiella sp.]|uniref:TetR/AcrR family transcriptional regulator n=1 Tax=Reichenbachiella sp. TaxID=2184521 RepID=UPI0032980F63
MTKTLKAEDKIKEAARSLFIEKGYEATRTRDIAEKSGINLALLNYYFKSKSQLFEMIMLETFQHFMKGVLSTLNDPNTSLTEKLEQFVDSYIDMLMSQPNLPYFIIGELKNKPGHLLEIIQQKETILQSVFFQQLRAKMPDTSPQASMQILVNLTSLTIFPFLAKPMIKGISHMSDPEFKKMMLERKKLIPKWIKMILDN